jgi:hypothetical protein
MWNGRVLQPTQLFEKARTMTTHVDHDPKAHPTGNAVKDPDHWTTGGEPMTGAQASYLQTLSEEAGTEFDPELTKAEASKKIDELQEETGRGE